MTDLFNNYRELRAKRADEHASCTHPIKVGDVIGWNPRTKRTQCADCWRRWVAENDEARMMERSV